MSAAIAAVAIGAGVSMYSASQSSKASAAQADAVRDGNRRSQELGQNNLEFQKGIYENQMAKVDEFESMFGPIRDNVNNYYKNMSPEMYQMQGKENIEKSYQNANKAIDATFSNNGMYGSGQQASAQVALEEARANALGQNKQNAMATYNQQQQNWLNYGETQMNQLRGFATGTANQIANVGMQNASNAQQGGQALGSVFGQQSQGWGQMASGGMQMAGYGVGMMKSPFGGQKTLAPTQGPSMPGQDPFGRY